MIKFLKKFKNWDGEHLKNIVYKIKAYIFGLQLDKKDENFRKGVINMIDECKTKISRDSDNNIDVKYSLRNILESIIQIMELKEEDLEAEEEDLEAEEDASWEEEKAEAEESETTKEWKKSKTKESE